MSLKINISNRMIDFTSSPYIIAELSANHNQSLDTALELVSVAADCKADAIKLQTYTASTLTLNSYKNEFYLPKNNNPWAGQRLWELYSEAYTPWEWHKPIFQKARELGLGCISTAFDQSSVDFLVDLRVDAIKIASFELIHIPLIKYASLTGLPLILSTGMASYNEITEAVDTILATSNVTPILLKCTSSYPASPGDANICTIPDLANKFNAIIGISDHSMSNAVVTAAVALGARVIEKHLTLSRSSGGPDSSFSLEPKEFKQMVNYAHESHQALGKISYGIQISEQSSAWERPSIWVTKSIKQGDLFSVDNIRIIRPSGGLHPREFSSIIGKRAKCAIDAETPLKLIHLSHN